MKLLLKYRQENSIYVNHIDIKSIENSCLKNNLSYLSQDVPIINGNLRENFFFNKSYSSDLEDKIKNEPFLSSILKNKDMDSIIGDHGANLSGGERQKISVARILYDQKDLLILDEITSNIDDKSARKSTLDS